MVVKIKYFLYSCCPLRPLWDVIFVQVDAELITVYWTYTVLPSHLCWCGKNICKEGDAVGGFISPLVSIHVQHAVDINTTVPFTISAALHLYQQRVCARCIYQLAELSPLLLCHPSCQGDCSHSSGLSDGDDALSSDASLIQILGDLSGLPRSGLPWTEGQTRIEFTVCVFTGNTGPYAQLDEIQPTDLDAKKKHIRTTMTADVALKTTGFLKKNRGARHNRAGFLFSRVEH